MSNKPKMRKYEVNIAIEKSTGIRLGVLAVVIDAMSHAEACSVANDAHMEGDTDYQRLIMGELVLNPADYGIRIKPGNVCSLRVMSVTHAYWLDEAYGEYMDELMLRASGAATWPYREKSVAQEGELDLLHKFIRASSGESTRTTEEEVLAFCNEAVSGGHPQE